MPGDVAPGSHVQRLEKARLRWWIRSWMAKRPPKAAVRVTPVPMTSASRNTMMEACARNA